MAKKGQTFQRYTEEFKKKAVQRYEKGEESYRTIAADLGLRSSTQLRQWAKKESPLICVEREQIQRKTIHSKAIKEIIFSRLRKNGTI